MSFYDRRVFLKKIIFVLLLCLSTSQLFAINLDKGEDVNESNFGLDAETATLIIDELWRGFGEKPKNILQLLQLPRNRVIDSAGCQPVLDYIEAHLCLAEANAIALIENQTSTQYLFQECKYLKSSLSTQANPDRQKLRDKYLALLSEIFYATKKKIQTKAKKNNIDVLSIYVAISASIPKNEVDVGYAKNVQEALLFAKKNGININSKNLGKNKAPDIISITNKARKILDTADAMRQ